ncbi:hypothetical protein AAVH_14174 [Aphelenchoides avenae]|nr:hypothetical protein AAVH_14174 [Aphelenchus avenae]
MNEQLVQNVRTHTEHSPQLPAITEVPASNAPLVDVHLKGMDSLPLSAQKVVDSFSFKNARSIAQYFISAEKHCDGMDDLGVAHVDTYNVNVPVSVAWRRPGFISARTPANWKPTMASTSGNFMKNYLRNIAHYFDWASYIPELKELSDSDQGWRYGHQNGHML